MKKKITLIVTCVVLVAAIAIGGTLAWFSDKAGAQNVVTMGNVSIILNDDYKPEENTTATPNATIKKVVSVTNDGANPAYIRVSVTPYWVGADGNPDTSLDASLIKVNFKNPEKWVLSGDYWYYQEVVSATGTTATLFEDFTLSEEIGNDYANKTAHIDVVAEAIQSENFDPEIVDEKIVGWGNAKIEEYNPSSATQE